MSVSLCIHKAANEIGGNCIEIKASSGERLLLDAGRPLDTPDDEPTPIPPTLDTERPVSGVLLSHSHPDHYGLLESLPAHWPVYCGKATERILLLAAATRGKDGIAQSSFHWENGKAILVGPFTVTPHLIDHSAFDAYALQVNVEGKTIFYSGDFRAHGRKAKLTEELMRTPPSKVDVLVMEGTNLPVIGSPAKPTPTETELEAEFADLFQRSRGRVFVSWSSTNVDRTVTLYRACKRSGRTLVPDLYCMLVLMRLKEFASIPQPEWDGGHMRAVVTKKMIWLMERLGESGLIEYLKENHAAMSASKLAATPEKWVIMARDSLVDDYRAKSVEPTDSDTWIWSMWSGYLRQESTRMMQDFFAPCKKVHLHSSGHASPELLRRFAESMRARTIIPVHGEKWLEYTDAFTGLTPLQDGQWMYL